MGHDMALKSIKEGKACLLIFASDISPRLVGEFKTAQEKFAPQLQYVTLGETISDLHMALGYKAGVITVDDINFSKKIIQLINQEETAYGN